MVGVKIANFHIQMLMEKLALKKHVTILLRFYRRQESVRPVLSILTQNWYQICTQTRKNAFLISARIGKLFFRTEDAKTVKRISIQMKQVKSAFMNLSL